MIVALAIAQEIQLSGPLVGASSTTSSRDDARGDDDKIDVRAPLRFGFAYTGITNAPELSFSMGLDVDVLHITRDLTFQVALDIEANSRPDLPDQDPLSSFGGIGVGAGLFYMTDGDVGLGFDVIASLTFDAQNLVGAGFGTRAYVYPFYMRADAAGARRANPMSAWVRSAISIWAMARVDFTSDGNGATVAFGASLDLFRIFVLPYVTALSNY